MGTTDPQPEQHRGVISRAGGQVSLIMESTSDAAYGRRGGSLYPLILCLVLAIVIAGSSAPVGLAGGGICLVLLAVWIGGRR